VLENQFFLNRLYTRKHKTLFIFVYRVYIKTARDINSWLLFS